MRAFPDLFRGRNDVYGDYGSIEGASPTDRGKLTSSAQTVRKPVTPELYQRHLDGDRRLGIVPVMEDGTVCWFVIDVDYYQTKDLHKKIAKKIKERGLPLVQTQSKSGGAHLWCFFEIPVQAALAIDMAREWIETLELPEDHVEIFPKQSSAPENVGSWVNLPYFGNTARCVGEDGEQDLTLEQFLVYANARVTNGPLRPKKSKNPPCIDTMIREGVEEGERNNALIQYGVFAKKAYGDDWEDRVERFNDESVNPPVGFAELGRTIESLRGKEYAYLCRSFTRICDRDTCLKRQFGVGHGVSVAIENIMKVESEDPLYLIRMDGINIQVRAATLIHFGLFRVEALKRLNKILPQMKQPEWEAQLNDMMLTMLVENAPDISMADQLWLHFTKWATQTVKGRPENIEIRPWYEDNAICFLGENFLASIEKQLKITRAEAWLAMRARGAVEDIITHNGKRVKIWKYPHKGDLWFKWKENASI